MWALHQRSKSYGQRPSSGLITDEPLLAWCFDEAVGTFGHWVEAKLSQTKDIKRGGRVVKRKPRYTLDQILGTTQYVEPDETQFKAMFG